MNTSGCVLRIVLAPGCILSTVIGWGTSLSQLNGTETDKGKKKQTAKMSLVIAIGSLVGFVVFMVVAKKVHTCLRKCRERYNSSQLNNCLCCSCMSQNPYYVVQYPRC